MKPRKRALMPLVYPNPNGTGKTQATIMAALTDDKIDRAARNGTMPAGYRDVSPSKPKPAPKPALKSIRESAMAKAKGMAASAAQTAKKGAKGAVKAAAKGAKKGCK